MEGKSISLAHRIAISLGHLLLLLLLESTKSSRVDKWTNGQMDTMDKCIPCSSCLLPDPQLTERAPAHESGLLFTFSASSLSFPQAGFTCFYKVYEPLVQQLLFKLLLLIHQWPAIPYCFTMAPADLSFSLSLFHLLLHSLGRHHSKTKYLSKP